MLVAGSAATFPLEPSKTEVSEGSVAPPTAAGTPEVTQAVVAASAAELAVAKAAQPKRLHVSNIPFRFRDPDLRAMFGVSTLWDVCTRDSYGLFCFSNSVPYWT